MKRLIGVVAGLLAVCALPALVTSARAADDNPIHKATLTISSAVLVGEQSLPAGTYKFECKVVDGKEMMIFMSQKGKELARVPCTQSNLAGKAEFSGVRTRLGPDGKAVLLSVQIKGETIAHNVAPVS